MILKKYIEPKSKNYKEKIGFKNEKQTAYLLDFERENCPYSFIMHNVKFEISGKTAQIDHLIITPTTCYVIEDKYFSGEVEIDENNNWNIKYKDKIISIPSPELQNERHIEVLKELFKQENLFKRIGFRIEPYFEFINTVLISDKTVFRGKMPKYVKKASQFKEIRIQLVKDRFKSITTILNVMVRPDMNEKKAKELAELLLSYDIQEQKNEKKLNDDLFEELRKIRYSLAKKEKKKPYMIFSDKTLQEMIESSPKTKEDMLNIPGIGELKYNKYGYLFLKELLRK